jgi:hypothetical protein
MFIRAIVFRWQRTIGDEGGDGRVVVAAVLDVIAASGPGGGRSAVLVMPARDTRLRSSDGQRVVSAIGSPERLALEHVTDDVSLRTGVVDVGYTSTRRPQAQDAHQRVAEAELRRWPILRGLVRVDGRVLDDSLTRGDREASHP